MTENEQIDAVVKDLRTMAAAGENVPSLLRHVQHSFGRMDCELVAVQYFHKAFGAGVASISPIAGWCGFGGELTNAEVESFVGAILKDYQRANAKLETNVAWLR